MLRRAGRIASRIAKSTSSKSTVLAAPRLTVPSPFFKNIARGYYSNNSQEAAFEPQIGVSKSYTDITTEKMEDFLIRNRVVYKVRPNGQVVIKECPFCTRPHNNKITNLWTLNLKENNGAFLCFRCGSHGSWYDFVRYILGDTINFDSRRTRDAVVEGSSTEDEVRLRNERTKLVVEESCKMHMDLLATIEKLEKLESQEEKSEENQNKGEKEDVDIDLKSGLIGINTLEYLVGTENNTQRHLSIETLKAFKIGIGEEAFKNDEGELIRVPVVNYPLFKPTAKKSKKPSDCNLIDNTLYDCVRSKLRGVGPSHKHHQRFKPAGGHFGVFGLNLVTPSSKIVVVTEGEFDAMAVYEATGLPAVSLPNGASNLPAQLVGYLEKVERIYLWMDNDEAGQMNIESFVNKLGPKRTYIVQTDGEIKDANDALRKDPNLIKKYIEKASPILSRNLIRFEDLRELVKSRILNRDLNSGIKSSFFPWFNRTLKGFRRGEFTIFTGPTGSGKTTFLSQLSLDFAKSGVPTLWCSFELKNEVLLSSMLNQFAGTDLQKEPAKFDYYADQFENIPLYFQTYFGSTHVDDVTTMIDYAIYTHDIGHVVIDNLQFMLSGQGRGIERFEMQDDVIAKLRKLATAKNIHITLVIHPRKGEDNQDLNVSSVFGTAKSTQEADNVLILQLRDKYRVIDIKKNRYDGEIGKSSLWFDRVSKRYEQISAKEIEELLTGTKIEDIIQRKGREIKEDMLTMIDNEGIQTITDPSNPTSTPHPVSENTDQHLHKLLEEKFAPQNPQKSHLYKAFTKVHNIQSNRRKNIEESDLSMQTQHGIKLSVNDNFEPEPFELSGDSIAFNSEADKINYREGVDAKTESSPAKTRKHAGSKVSVEKTKEEINKPATSSAKPQEHRKQQSTEQAEEDPFDVKFEGDYSQIDISVPLNNMPVESPIGSGDQPFAESNLTTAERTQEAASTTQSQSRRGRPANPSKLAMKEVLAGLQARADPPKYIDNLFQEGEVVATYNDMIEELVANNRPRKKGDYSQNKGQYKYNSKETNGQTKVKIMGPSQNTSSKSGNNRN